MKSALTERRAQFFNRIAKNIPRHPIQLVLLTHILHDRPELFDSFQSIAPIRAIVSIPYSAHAPTVTLLKKSYRVVEPSLEQLTDERFLSDLVEPLISSTPLAILEIGGYFSGLVNVFKERFGDAFLGVIEDTERGHRQYLKISALDCPVISVARSPLKRPEDSLVGPSCIYSVESILRGSGFSLGPIVALVIGYGRVGSGLATVLRGRGCRTLVYDVDPLRRVQALADGFATPSRSKALGSADAIFGATGTCSIGEADFQEIKNGSLLISCSSRDIEFDVAHLKTKYTSVDVAEGMMAYRIGGKTLYLLTEGHPVNFAHGAVIGPILSLVQAELLLALDSLWKFRQSPGLHSVPEENTKWLAEEWLQTFLDSQSGTYLVV